MKYEDVFRHRGKSYDLAMKTYPNARDQEFKKLFHNIPIKENENNIQLNWNLTYADFICK
jgi:hypothetical protein